ncbi:MAG: hypothetical protein KME07_16455 [Pegethrix bostrychoides GSE-TBD4-15B]|uniref:Uncharacterized protein n=1 Tax=Pegethrix bostrychoides GSE-TBD4-15B TaxID=2839662 RepID=A0A951PC80_9CYAN|nr:hypothetical protein [Pegethrix bostrychoides GSE-TBD4-15B]
MRQQSTQTYGWSLDPALSMSLKILRLGLLTERRERRFTSGQVKPD